MLWKCCTQYASKFGKISSDHSTGKFSFDSNAKECSNCHTTVHISHAIKVTLKILQARFQQYVNHEFPGVQAGFRKGRGTRDQIANILWIIEKVREFQKKKKKKKIYIYIYFCFIDDAKAFGCVDYNKLKILKRCEYQTTLPISWKRYMQVKKQQLEHGTMDCFNVEKDVQQGCLFSPYLFNLYARYIM